MNVFTLALASIRSRPLQATLCVMAVSIGIALLCAIFLLSQSVQSGFLRNAQNINMVVGAKGSPLQLVLSSVYHADIPQGNISLQDYEKIERSSGVERAIPLVMGDNYRGWRMIGSVPGYINLYGGKIGKGRMFHEGFETVAGARTGLNVGDQFAVSHGFSADSRDVHDENLYTVTGVLEATGTVLDKVLVTSIKSVQDLHHNHEYNESDTDHDHEEHHEHDQTQGHDQEHENHDEHNHGETVSHKNKTQTGQVENSPENQITAVFVDVKSPIALMNLPRQLNASPNLTVAVPSYEIARLTKNLGIGKKVVMIVGGIVTILSALILLASLLSGLSLRRYDLAILRVLGATQAQLSATIIAESVILSLIGAFIGVIIGHSIAYFVVISTDSLNGLVIANDVLMPQFLDVKLMAIGIIVGVIAAIVPSISAARTQITNLLAKGKN